MFEAWNVAKGRKVQGGRILSQGTVYTLHTLINKHVHQKKEGKIFACFIDFKKAFYSIWHEGLFYKILQSGLGGKLYDLIKCMYTENKCAIKIKNQRT